jgi:DNA-binding ferritin-like protein
MTRNEAAHKVTTLLAALRAAHWSHWTSHWQTKGNPYYGDHLLLERLYNAITEEIDTLAEKSVAFYGPECVDPVAQANMMSAILANHAVADPILRAMRIEQVLQAMFKDTFDTLEAGGQLSLGLNDFIAAAANAHETAIYLLQQRLR